MPSKLQTQSFQVLVGTQITCDEADDERDWRLVKDMGVACKDVTRAVSLGLWLGVHEVSHGFWWAVESWPSRGPGAGSVFHGRITSVRVGFHAQFVRSKFDERPC